MKLELIIPCIFTTIVHCQAICSYLDSFEYAAILLDQNVTMLNEDTMSRENISTYLERCLYLRMSGLNLRLLCQHSCAVTETCLAYFFGSDGTCDVCLTKLVRPLEYEHQLAEVNVHLTKLGARKGENYLKT